MMRRKAFSWFAGVGFTIVQVRLKEIGQSWIGEDYGDGRCRREEKI